MTIGQIMARPATSQVIRHLQERWQNWRYNYGLDLGFKDEDLCNQGFLDQSACQQGYDTAEKPSRMLSGLRKSLSPS
jgi:hypothetical protein